MIYGSSCAYRVRQHLAIVRQKIRDSDCNTKETFCGSPGRREIVTFSLVRRWGKFSSRLFNSLGCLGNVFASLSWPRTWGYKEFIGRSWEYHPWHSLVTNNPFGWQVTLFQGSISKSSLGREYELGIHKRVMQWLLRILGRFINQNENVKGFVFDKQNHLDFKFLRISFKLTHFSDPPCFYPL